MSEDATLDEFVNESDADSEKSEKEVRVGPREWNLPSEWSIITLGDLTSLITKGKTPTSYGFDYCDSGINFIKSESISEDGFLLPEKFDYISEEADSELSSSKLNDGDLLFSIAGTLGKVTRIDESFLPANTNQALAIIRTEDEINTDYLFYFLTGTPIQKYIKSISTVTAQPNLNLKQVSDFDIFSPPLSEQRKIATVLYNVDQAIQKTEEIINHTKRLRKAILNDLFISGYGENRAIQEGHVGPRKVEYPCDWLSVELGELTDNITKGKTPTSYGYEYTNSGINFVKVESISDYGSIDRSEFDFIGQDAHEHLSGSALEEGDVLFSIAGALGKVTQISEDVLPANTNQALAVIRINDSRAIPEYIRYYLETTLIQKYIQSIATTTAQSNLNLKQVSEFKILLPDINEQEKILQVIHTIEDKLRCENSQKEQYQRFKQGLMQDLLSGTVRTTDTNIEVPDEIAQHG